MPEQFLLGNWWFIILSILWTLPWKGVALWKAAGNKHKAWFVILLVVNTFAVLEIIYIFIFSHPSRKKGSSVESAEYVEKTV